MDQQGGDAKVGYNASLIQGIRSRQRVRESKTTRGLLLLAVPAAWSAQTNVQQVRD